MRTNLLDFTLPALTDWFASLGEKPFRAKQVFRWVHQRGESDFDAMTDLAKGLREKLKEVAEVRPPAILSEHRSADGTVKWLFDVGIGNGIETVFIPEDDRGTLCVSSQVGCALDCGFCSTGRSGFNRDLSVVRDHRAAVGREQAAEGDGEGGAAVPAASPAPSHEASARCRGRGEKEEAVPISNVVMMGMGEPLNNFENVVAAMQVMLDDHAYGLSRRRVTLSTSGVVHQLRKLAARCPVALAVSLHAPDRRAALEDHADQPQLRHRRPAGRLQGIPRGRPARLHHLRVHPARRRERRARARARRWRSCCATCRARST